MHQENGNRFSFLANFTFCGELKLNFMLLSVVAKFYVLLEISFVTGYKEHLNIQQGH